LSADANILEKHTAIFRAEEAIMGNGGIYVGLEERLSLQAKTAFTWAIIYSCRMQVFWPRSQDTWTVA
jgi:hypothetical protein